MWYEQLPKEKSWSRLWSDYTICGRCHGIRTFNGPCGVCGDAPFSTELQLMRDGQGRELLVSPACMGAEGRYEDWIYLGMMEREWNRPVLDSDRFPGFSPDKAPSPRASIVLLFWSYFETRIERLLRAGLREAPSRLTTYREPGKFFSILHAGSMQIVKPRQRCGSLSEHLDWTLQVPCAIYPPGG
jgi:hypothetical protein